MRYTYEIGTTKVTLPEGAVEDELQKLSVTHPEAAAAVGAALEALNIPELAWTDPRIRSMLEQFNQYLSGALDAQGLASAL